MSIHASIYENAQEAAVHCAAKILELLDGALKESPRATLAISGGSTPKLMFEELARAGFDWARVHLFWVDERGVPPTDPQSNYKLAKEAWLDAAHFPGGNVHRIQAEKEPELAARLYATEIREFFRLGPGELPGFDVIHQGMGPDAHTASLFPGQPLIEDQKDLVAALYVEKFQQWRITLLPGVLRAAKQTVMLVAGQDKAEPLRLVLHEPYNPRKYPVQIVNVDGRDVLWFLDRAAARGME
ncbi:MAG TPA: 6-phosphogluconolactonase [Bryobacteraceae bacterium]|nr:6-phosphogluconolactonase [Bryobacteraceae bacterium]